MKVTLKGNAAELEGNQPNVNEKAPQFSIENLYKKQISLEELAGEKILISVFPDINTSVCDKQTKEFFKRADGYKDLRIINISNNTQAQMSKWCATNNIENEMLSDKALDFGKAYGLYIPKFDILGRAVFVIDQNGMIVYKEVLRELTNEPNYDAAFDAVDAL